MNRRERIKKALGISEYPWSSGDESDNSDNAVAQRTEQYVEREGPSNNISAISRPCPPSILEDRVESHLRRMADRITRSLDTQTTQSRMHQEGNSNIIDINQLAIIKATHWIKMKKAFNSLRHRSTPYGHRYASGGARSQPSAENAIDDSRAGTSTSQLETSLNDNEEVVIISNGTTPARIVLRNTRGITSPGMNIQDVIEPERFVDVPLFQLPNANRRNILDGDESARDPSSPIEDDNSPDEEEYTGEDITAGPSLNLNNTTSSHINTRTISNQPAVTINKETETEENRSQEASNSLVQLNDKLLLLLECPVCLDTMAPPLKQCGRGHMVCASCRTQLEKCPLCRTNFSTIPNRAMESVTDLLKYPCRYGCGKKRLLKHRLTHEGNCPSRLYRCLVEFCDSVPMLLPALTEHFQVRL